MGSGCYTSDPKSKVKMRVNRASDMLRQQSVRSHLRQEKSGGRPHQSECARLLGRYVQDQSKTLVA